MSQSLYETVVTLIISMNVIHVSYLLQCICGDHNINNISHINYNFNTTNNIDYKNTYLFTTNPLDDELDSGVTCIDGTYSLDVENYNYFDKSCSYIEGSRINCEGAYSCEYPSQIVATHGSIQCYGDYSCANSNKIHGYNSVTCDGSNGCFNSTISSNESNYNFLWCGGDQSCSNANINSFYTIYGTGSYSLVNSYITCGNEPYNLVYIYLYGHYAAYNSTIECSINNECIIYCGDNACYNTNFLCNGDYGICTFEYFDDDSIDDNNNLIIYNSIIESNYYDNLCNNDTSLSFDNRDYSNSYNISLFFNICCRKSESCAYDNIKSNNVLTSSNIICNGYRSCVYSDISNNNKNIVCTGSESCKYAQIINENFNYYDNTTLYCGAYASCRSTDITSFNHLYCSGFQSCYDSTISKTQNIYLYASSAARFASIYSSRIGIMNIYIKSYWAGYGLNIFCAYGDTCNIKCETKTACYKVDIYCDEGICNVECDQDDINCPNYGIISNYIGSITAIWVSIVSFAIIN